MQLNYHIRLCRKFGSKAAQLRSATPPRCFAWSAKCSIRRKENPLADEKDRALLSRMADILGFVDSMEI